MGRKRPGYDREYYLAHREERLVTDKARRAANAEARRAYQREYSQRPEARARYNALKRERNATLKGQRYQRDYVAANAERIRVYKAAWYQANRERAAEQARQRHLADPRRATDRAREWERAHPARSAANHASKSANARAEMWGADGRLSGENVLDLWRREPDCLDCGDGRGLDHIVPLSRGGSNTTGNLANRCRSCNSRKGARERKTVAA